MRKRLCPWLIGLLVSTLLMAVHGLYTGFAYAGSDDAPMLRSSMGYEGGEPSTFHLYLHTALAWLLWALAKLFPGVAWFSILQLGFLWISSAVIVKSLCQIARRRGLPMLLGALAGACFLCCYAIYVSCRVSYTTTAALLGAAAVAQLWSVDATARPKELWSIDDTAKSAAVTRGVLASALLLLGGYCLRQLSVVPPLCFWLLTWCCKLHAARRTGVSMKPLLKGALLAAALFAVFVGVRAADIRLNNAETYLSWQNARINLFDYTSFEGSRDEEARQLVGWSEDQYALVSSGWYFMDNNISTEAFEKLRDYFVAKDGANASPFATVLSAIGGDASLRWGTLAALAMALTALVAPALRKERSPVPYLAVVCAVLGGLALLLYLGWKGRLPMRATVSVLFPMAACLFCLGMECLPTRTDGVTARAIAAIPLLLCAVCLGFGACDAFAKVAPQPVEEHICNAADLDAYALENPDMLFVYDLSLVGDSRMFPDTSAGIPTNVMFWGGWPSRSTSWYRQLERFDIRGLDGSIFLRENVRFASVDSDPWEAFSNYIEQFAGGQELYYDYCDSLNYVNFYQYYVE